MKILELKDADISLEEIKEYPWGKRYPHCKLHGAMNQITNDQERGNIWRCQSSYRLDYSENPNRPKLIENNCKAGCSEFGLKRIIHKVLMNYGEITWECVGDCELNER